MELIRSMIDEFVLTPRAAGRRLDVVPYGMLANILAVCAEANKPAHAHAISKSQLSVVAGAGFEPATFRL